jgi:phosphatidylserine/phosphatidylglycerophosphate/cardiolipin synthase-like enzyme
VGQQWVRPLFSRLHLLEKAEESGDLQYFLMKGDTAGDVMLHAVLKAADRGVRVRFLLDESNLVEFPRFEEVAAPARERRRAGPPGKSFRRAR